MAIIVEQIEDINELRKKLRMEDKDKIKKYFKPKEEGTYKILDVLLKKLNDTKSPMLWITHDSILALFVGALTQQIINHENWFDYLDGVCIKKVEKNILMFWGKKIINITDKCNQLQKKYGEEVHGSKENTPAFTL